MVYVAAPALLLCVILAAVPAAAQDHLRCMKIKDANSNAGITPYQGDLDTPMAGQLNQPGCRISSKAAVVCYPTRKSNVVPDPPGAAPGPILPALLCYKVRCAAAAAETTNDMKDQFGSRPISLGPKATKSGLVCAPVEPNPETPPGGG
jgi:hypothetical protein